MSKHLVLGIFLILCSWSAQAQQLLGGDISYEHVDSGEYVVKVNLYRACHDSSFASTISVLVSTSGGGKDSMQLARVAIMDNSHFCRDSTSPCSPQNKLGGAHGMEIHQYQTHINLDTGTYLSWIQNGACQLFFGYTGQHRKGDYLRTYDSVPLTIWAMLDVCRLKQCKDTTNSSVGSFQPLNSYLNVNTSYRLSVGGINLDRDSLIYDPICVVPSGVYGDPCTSSGWEEFLTVNCGLGTPPCTPIPQAKPPIGIYQDAQTGDLVFVPTQKGEQGEYFVRATDYRKDTSGKYISVGYSMRSITWIVDSFDNNEPPKLAGPYAYSICEEDTLCFDIKSTDADLGDTTYLQIRHNLEDAQFTYADSTAREKKGKLCWTPELGQGSSLPYQLRVTATDSACPRIGVSSKMYSITVKRKPQIDSLKVEPTYCSKAIFEGFGRAMAGIVKPHWRVLDLSDSLLFESANTKDSFTFNPDGGSYVFEFSISNSAQCVALMRDTVQVAPSLKMVNVGNLDRCAPTGINGSPGPIQNYPKTVNAVGTVSYGIASWGKSLLEEDTFTVFRQFAYRRSKVILFAKDSLGCQHFDSTELRTHFAYYPNLSKDRRLCHGDTFSFNLPEYANLSYLWSNGDTAPNLRITQTGTFSLSVSDSNQCINASPDVSIRFNLPARANAGKDTSICFQSNYLLVGGDSMSSTPTYNFTWYSYPNYSIIGGQKDLVIKVDEDKTYILSLRQSESGLTCIDDDTVHIQVKYPDPIHLLDSIAFCYSDSLLQLDSLSKPFISASKFELIEFNGETSGGLFNVAKQQLVGGNQLVMKNAPGRYLLKARNTNSSCLSEDTTQVTVNPEPRVLQKHKDTLCQDLELGLNVYSKPALTSGVFGSGWSGKGVTNQRIVTSQLLDTSIHKTFQGPYAIYANYIDPKTTCISWDSIEFYIQRSPKLELNPRDSVSICQGDELDIQVNANYITNPLMAMTKGDGTLIGNNLIYTYQHGSKDLSQGSTFLHFRTIQNLEERCLADTQELKVKVNPKPQVQFEVLGRTDKDSVTLNNVSQQFHSGFYILNQSDTLLAQLGIQHYGKLITGFNQAQLWVKDSNGCEDSTSIYFPNRTHISILTQHGIYIPTLWENHQSIIRLKGQEKISHMQAQLFSPGGAHVQLFDELPLFWKGNVSPGVYLLIYSMELKQGDLIHGQTKILIH